MAPLTTPMLRYRLSASQVSFSEDAVSDSLLVARHICERDSTLQERQPQSGSGDFSAVSMRLRPMPVPRSTHWRRCPCLQPVSCDTIRSPGRPRGRP